MLPWHKPPCLACLPARCLQASCVVAEQMQLVGPSAALLAEWGAPQPLPVAPAEQRQKRVQEQLASWEQLIGQWTDPGLQEFYGNSSTLAKVAYRRVRQRAAQQAQ